MQRDETLKGAALSLAEKKLINRGLRGKIVGAYMLIKHEEVEPIEFDGLKIIDYTAGRDISSSFAEITVPVGVSHKLSWSNRSDKYYYVIKGSVVFTVGEESSELSAGDFCIVPKGVRFRYSNTGSEDGKIILVHTPSFKLECEEFEEK